MCERKRKLVWLAFSSKNVNMIKFLHERGLFNFIDYLDEYKRTILFECASFNAAEILGYLIEIGVPKGQKDCNGESYLEYGAKEFEFMILESLDCHIHRYKFPDMPINMKNLLPLEECFTHQVNWNQKIIDHDNTLLHVACSEIFNKHLNACDGIIMQLLNHGADPYCVDMNQKTPLSIAEDIFSSRSLEETLSNVERAKAIIEKMRSLKKI